MMLILCYLTVMSQDTRRIDWVLQRDFPSVKVLIYELDIAMVWHGNIPPVNGVIVCYDTADKASFSPVEDFLRTLLLSCLLVIDDRL